MIIADEDIGGAHVKRLFQNGAYRPGMTLSRDEVLAMRNRQALIDSNYISIFPRPPVGFADAERHIVHNGGGRYDVIAGRKLNTSPLSKDDAEDLATRPN